MPIENGERIENFKMEKKEREDETFFWGKKREV